MEDKIDITKKRTRADIMIAIDVLENGKFKYHKANHEEDGWNYLPQINEMVKEGKLTKEKLESFRNRFTGALNHKLDLRFTDGYVSVLVEVKRDFDSCWNEAVEQLKNYVEQEKLITNNDQIIAILANENNQRIVVWKGAVQPSCCLKGETYLRSFSEYQKMFYGRINDPYKVERCAYELNEMFEAFGVETAYRADIASGCIRSLGFYTPTEFQFTLMSSELIIDKIKKCTDTQLKGNESFEKQIAVLKHSFDNANVKKLKDEHWHKVLKKIKEDLIPYINMETCVGQDILNIFYTVFNKYVGRKDKNQAFTPNHLVHFLCKVAEVNRHSRVLDPTCGSGSFLIRSISEAIEDARGDKWILQDIKSSHVYGIEAEERAWGYTISNMLLHNNVECCDNIKNCSCFDVTDAVFKKWGIDTVIMNPPFNAQYVNCNPEYAIANKWSVGPDPTKGFHFALWAAQKVGKGKLVVILPTACAIADSSVKEIHKVKKLMLEEHTLDAVFSLPSTIFYPGASVDVCCMVFTLGKRHDSTKPTFFGYFREDGFGSKKHLGRVEKQEGTWDAIEKKWLDLYFSKKEEIGMSCLACVTADDEWCAEAFMETNYTQFSNELFEQAIRDFVSYHVANDNKF